MEGRTSISTKCIPNLLDTAMNKVAYGCDGTAYLVREGVHPPVQVDGGVLQVQAGSKRVVVLREDRRTFEVWSWRGRVLGRYRLKEGEVSAFFLGEDRFFLATDSGVFSVWVWKGNGKMKMETKYSLDMDVDFIRTHRHYVVLGSKKGEVRVLHQGSEEVMHLDPFKRMELRGSYLAVAAGTKAVIARVWPDFQIVSDIGFPAEFALFGNRYLILASGNRLAMADLEGRLKDVWEVEGKVVSQSRNKFRFYKPCFGLDSKKIICY